jgi:hypothetical protein
MSDTPRTDAAYTLSTGAGIYELFKESQDIERELNAASKERDDALMMLGMYRMKSDEQKHRIKRLEEALGCVVVSCDYLHHRKKHQHRSGEPCPVEELILEAKEAKL